MTSWLKHTIVKAVEKKNMYMFETTDAGFCSQFNNYLYSALYADKEGIPLYVHDTVNALSIHYPLIKDTFIAPPEISFTDGPIFSATSLKKRVRQINEFISAVDTENLKLDSKSLLQWNPSLLTKLQPILDGANLPSDFDVGVHIRAGDKITSGEMKSIPIEQYLRAVQAYQTKAKKKSLDIFIMSDSSQKLDEFIKKKDPSWKVYSLGSPPSIAGHVQRDFNASLSRSRMNAYLYFVAELFLIQKVHHIVCTFSSNVGRFLFLTADDEASVVSIDNPTFTPY